MNITDQPTAVSFSGVPGSTSVLAIAECEGYRPYAPSCGLQHEVELATTRWVAAALEAVGRLAEYRVWAVRGSALTAEIEMPQHERVEDWGDGISVAYVEARSTICLSFALSCVWWA